MQLQRVIFCLCNVVALSMLDEFSIMMRTKVQIIFFNFPVLVIFSAKCCNFSMYLCYHAFLDCLV